MVAFQRAFPLDYIILTCIIYYFVTCTMAGVRALGVRFCGMQVYKMRQQRTAPQALLFLCA